jgi:hypothetical protein
MRSQHSMVHEPCTRKVRTSTQTRIYANFLADALRQAGADVRVHHDHFSPNARDEEWLEALGLLIQKEHAMVGERHHARQLCRLTPLFVKNDSRLTSQGHKRGGVRPRELGEVFYKTIADMPLSGDRVLGDPGPGSRQ